MKVAVIPARGGSKRIPRKNIRVFFGAPLISYSIKTAMESGLFDKVIVSTDDDEIATIAKRSGAQVPFKRPVELADDYAGTMEVMQHAARFIHDENPDTSHICCIYPAAVFMEGADLVDSLDVLVRGGFKYVFSATTYDYPIQRALTLRGGGIEMFYPEFTESRSQDLEEVVHDAGQFYWGTTEAWLSQAEVLTEDSQIIRIPRYRAIDIDTEEDWIMAEQMYSALKKK